MEDVIKDIQKLHSLLHKKLEEIAVRERKVHEAKIELEERAKEVVASERRQAAANNQLAARERLVLKGEDLNDGIQECKDEQDQIKDERKLLADRIRENLHKSKELDKEIAKMQEAQERFCKKRDSAQAEYVKTIAREKELAAVIKSLNLKVK